MLEYSKDKTCFGGYPLEELAAQFGTPLYVYDQARIEDNYHRLMQAYRERYPHFEIFYAIKANNNPAIVKTLADLGAGADASCIEEILLAKLAGVPPKKILFTGVYSTKEQLRRAAELNVILNLEDISQIEWLDKMPEFISFRVNPGIGQGGKEGLIFAGPDAKFGVPESQIKEAYRLAKAKGAKRFGIHMMTGSNILDVAYFESIVDRLLMIMIPIAKELKISFEFIDIGGSLGVPYEKGVLPLDIEEVAERVTQKIKASPFNGATILHEPGRYLVADAGILLTRVASIKRAEKTFIGIDAGMNTLLRPALYKAYHPIDYVNQFTLPHDQQVNVVGQICENTDVIAQGRFLPKEIKVGDLLSIGVVGAYGFCMSSQYNTRPRAAEVLIRKGIPYLIRERETFDDLVAKTRMVDD
ncbi:MAG: diaminopimelate decarboxylase [Simkaniaceae bacterium]|nr:diaminopimelate decarboxylase [Simkaniaceae bacterium]